MTVQIKICGLSTPETLEAAIENGADFIGLVFYPPSPRNVSIERGAALADQARGKTKIVALTVDANDELLAQIRDKIRPDFIQAHGSETPSRIAEMQEQTGVQVIKAIKVSKAADIDTAREYAPTGAMLLFDAKAPEDMADALPGGNGLIFDWNLLAAAKIQSKYMLSGGLNDTNVAQAIAITGAPIVDVSSGVEESPGKKDLNLIKKFIEAVRSPR